VLEELHSLPITVQDLHIDVDHERIQLRGIVDSLSEMRSIYHLVSGLPGIREVQNCLTVGMPTGMNDTDVKQAMDRLLRSRGFTDVLTCVNRGTVRLSGGVRSLAERNAIDRLARSLPGITRIMNDVRISTSRNGSRIPPDDAALTSRVNEILRSADHCLSGQVRGIVSQKTLYLRGTVGRADDRQIAINLARRVEGIERIRNEIEVDHQPCPRR
jgi:osmotically-inducible protein OsmY